MRKIKMILISSFAFCTLYILMHLYLSQKLKNKRLVSNLTYRHFNKILASDSDSIRPSKNGRYNWTYIRRLRKAGGFFMEVDRNDKYKWNYTGQLNTEFPQFAPAINITEYTRLMELIAIVTDACETFDITYMLEGGAVLGAYLHHGFIPWDDDIDCKVNVSQKEILKKALADIPGHTLHSPNNSLWKFYNNNFAKAGRRQWNWPFIDILFFKDNETHVYDVTPNGRIIFDPRADILPLEKGIFESMIFPVPRDMKAYLSRRYKMQGQCVSTHWSHRTESRRRPFSIPCHKLLGVYPFVHQFQLGNTSFEELRLGDKVLHTVERPSMQLLKHPDERPSMKLVKSKIPW